MSPKLRQRIQKRIEKEQAKSRGEEMLPKLVEHKGGIPVIKDQLPTIFHLRAIRRANPTGRAGRAHVVRATLPSAYQSLLDRYDLRDAAIKVVRVGSVGTACWVLLFMAGEGDPLFLQVKRRARRPGAVRRQEPLSEPGPAHRARLPAHAARQRRVPGWSQGRTRTSSSASYERGEAGDGDSSGRGGPMTPTDVGRPDTGTLRFDLIAGLTAAAVVLPKAMAYATVAGLPVAVGLYTAFVPMVAYTLLGNSVPSAQREFHGHAGDPDRRAVGPGGARRRGLAGGAEPGCLFEAVRHAGWDARLGLERMLFNARAAIERYQAMQAAAGGALLPA